MEELSLATTPPQIIELRDGSRIHLRCATAHDAAALTALRRDIDDPVSTISQPDAREAVSLLGERIASFKTNPDRLWLLAADQAGILIGHARCAASIRPRHSHVASVSLGVAPGWRGRGVGRALLRRLIDWARCHGSIQKLTLNVLSRNRAAIRLYATSGFRIVGTRRHEIRLNSGRFANETLMELLFDSKSK